MPAFNPTGSIGGQSNSGSISNLTPRIPGRHYALVEPGAQLFATTSGPANNFIYFYDVTLTRDVPMDQLGIFVQAVGTGAHAGIYQLSPSTGRATGLPLAVSALIDASSTSPNERMAAIASGSLLSGGKVILPAGHYACGFQSNNSTIRVGGLTGAMKAVQTGAAAVGNTLNLAGGGGSNYQFEGAAFGVFPDLTGATFVETADDRGAYLLYRAAAL